MRTIQNFRKIVHISIHIRTYMYFPAQTIVDNTNKNMWYYVHNSVWKPAGNLTSPIKYNTKLQLKRQT